ncbi:hypothetical protein AGDE_00442 [Angomonas deanei]|nr:hypothetical protein AGDE_05097 [Angomonas deanei]EPY43479.1 hypothetical protein AGDE_00442 [Angomonas deanei]|eukprot:EPY38832.1 hypothetical protein AGDE_05097 [Angomonas deanei]
MSDPAKQNAVMRAAALVPQCKKEQLALRRCQRVQGRDCEAEALNTVYCGMVYLSQRLRQQERQSEEPTATS